MAEFAEALIYAFAICAVLGFAAALEEWMRPRHSGNDDWIAEGNQRPRTRWW